MKNKKAFTLIELMVVVIIIGILASISIPSFNKSMENARAKEAHTTLELIYNAEKVYRLDKKAYCIAPSATSPNWANFFNPYIENPNLNSEYYNYIITGNSTSYTARADRKGTDPRYYTIDQTGTKLGSISW